MDFRKSGEKNYSPEFYFHELFPSRFYMLRACLRNLQATYVISPARERRVIEYRKHG